LTSPKPLKFEKKSSDHEAIFLNYYDWLLSWARQHTQGASEESEDLVQDLYVRFVQMKSGPVFTDDDQVRAYLYTSLKNLFISRKLRSGRDAVSGLLAVDFDSVEFAVSSVDRSQLLHVRSDLAGICEYACIRRRTNRAASALILRFFLSYLASEVMALLKAKRSNIDTLIETARLEAKAYLSRPGVLRFLGRNERKAVSFPRYLPEQPDALFAELQRRIFSETEGTCLPPEELGNRYLQPNTPSFSTQEIAHLTSCRICLNRASRLLGLPDLTLRFFTEGDPPEGANPASRKPGDEGLKKLRRRLRETYEHRPKKLQIAVDGEVRGVQTITAPSSNFQISLAPLSQRGFVEVLSEQGIGLLYFDSHQEEVDVPGPRVAAVDLSDGRQLSVTLTMVGGAPVLDVSYYDPLLEVDLEGWPSATAPLSDPLATGPYPVRQSEPEPTRKDDRWLSRLFSYLRARPPLLLAIVIGLCVVMTLGIVYIRTKGEIIPRKTAATILAQSEGRTASGIPPHGAVRKTFSLEVRSGPGTMSGIGEVVLLRSSERPIQALCLRAAGGDLIAGHWTDAGGTGRDRSRKEKSTPGDEARAITMQDGIWKHPPDAADFERLAGDNQALELRELSDSYEVSFRRPATSNEASIIEGHLIVATATMHPIAETLFVRSDNATREYRFKQVGYDLLRPDQVRPSDFVPDFSVHSLHRNVISNGEAHLTLEALRILSDQPQEIQAAVDLERLQDGGVAVKGVLSSEREAKSLTQSLRALHGGASLSIDLHSTDEPRPPHRLSRVELIPPVSIATDRVPFDGMLRAALDANSDLTGAEREEMVKQAAREILVRGARIDRSAWIVSQIGARDFRSNELSAMSPQDRQLWLALLERPLTICETELNAIEAALSPASVPIPHTEHPLEPAGTVHELAVTSNSFRQNADRLDQFLMAGFALTPEVSSSPASPVELLDRLAQVQREESKLELTVRRLQRAAPNHQNE
jgi:DNA-directed RNA polymerase specialized sigma24 family protein